MSISKATPWQTILGATIVIALLVGWWWHGQSARQPQDTPVRQTLDIRSASGSDQQSVQNAIDALGPIPK